METRLHSYETYLYKYLLPVLWFPWDGFRSARRAFPPTDPNNGTMMWGAIIIWCVTYGLVVFYGFRLKTVFLNETVRGLMRRNPTFYPPDMQSMLAYDLPTQSELELPRLSKPYQQRQLAEQIASLLG